RELVDVRQRQPHLVGERRQVVGRQLAVMVLDQVEVLDQEVAPARPVAEQRLDLGQRRRLDLAALRVADRLAPSGARMQAGLRLNASVRLHDLARESSGWWRGAANLAHRDRSWSG